MGQLAIVARIQSLYSRLNLGLLPLLVGFEHLSKVLSRESVTTATFPLQSVASLRRCFIEFEATTSRFCSGFSCLELDYPF